jgi:hypothetical protein
VVGHSDVQTFRRSDVQTGDGRSETGVRSATISGRTFRCSDVQMFRCSDVQMFRQETEDWRRGLIILRRALKGPGRSDRYMR